MSTRKDFFKRPNQLIKEADMKLSIAQQRASEISKERLSRNFVDEVEVIRMKIKDVNIPERFK